MSRADIDTFLATRRVAVVGVSRTEARYTRVVYRGFVKNGYDVMPVHPAGGDFDGRQAVKAVADIQPAADAALILTPADQYAALAAECLKAGIKKLWFRRPAPAVDGALVVSGECPLMWLAEGEWIHGFHKTLRGWVGTLPK
jgi:predicted CoA-binding protein